MRISILLAAVLLSASIGLAQDTAGRPAPRPNIIFILMDDMRWDCMSCAGHPFIKTPNLDRIAKEGAMFTNYFVTLPLCSPSRATLLTGQYAHRNGVIDNVTDHSELSHKLVTYPMLLQKAGYETAFLGKWHMGLDSSPRPGFDKWVGFRGQGVYKDPPLNFNGNVQKVTGYTTDLLSGYAVEFIRQKHEKPYSICLFHKAVHQPNTPADRHATLYADDPLPASPNMKDDLSGKPMLTRKVPATSPAGHPDWGVSEKQIRNQIRCIQSVDDGVGLIFKALEETGQLENTLIVFSSDNGYFWNEHHLGDKRAAYEESIRDPLLMRYPRLIKPGTKIDQIALNVDIAPTFLALAGAAIPSDMQGKSLLPLLAGVTANWRTGCFLEYFWEKPYPLIPTWQAVRTDDWKYIEYSGVENMNELYNLKLDPGEMKNLIADPACAAKLKELQAELARLRDENK
jgi:N-acetylglucosamine-6-sulfatase